MRKINILPAVLGAAFLLSACHVPHHHVPPGQAKKGWHKSPGHHKGPKGHKLHESRLDAAPKFY